MNHSLLRKLFSIVLSTAAALIPLSAPARTAADFFIGAPASQIMMLDRNTRLDMIDYFNNGMQNTSANSLRGKSRITAMSPEKIEVQLSEGSSMQLSVFTQERDTLLVIVETVHTPVADSKVEIFTAGWQALKYGQPAMPSADDFVPRQKKAQARSVEMPDIVFVRADFDPATGVFTMTNTTPGYYTEYDRPDGLKLMRSAIDMKWNGKKLVEIKESGQ